MTKSTNLPRICLDACVWIALIQRQLIPATKGSPETRFDVARRWVNDAKDGKVKIIAPTLVLVEVCKMSGTTGPDLRQKLDEMFDRPEIILSPLTDEIALKARDIRIENPKTGRNDSIYVATALLNSCEMLVTFDKGILALNTKLTSSSGNILSITGGTAAMAGPLFVDSSE